MSAWRVHSQGTPVRVKPFRGQKYIVRAGPGSGAAQLSWQRGREKCEDQVLDEPASYSRATRVPLLRIRTLLGPYRMIKPRAFWGP